MKLLLDTHVAIWATNTPERIPERIRNLIVEDNNEIAVSAASIWEIAIKHQLGRMDAPPLSGYEAITEFESAGFDLLNVTPAHAALVERLPPLHADPFDRLMLAQAITEDMRFVTYDRQLSRYGVGLITWS
ncbi:type II toxin-antitoxin system VapC family toxin [Mesorhizobium koreense]|uniref:type II toxin-antitoxin system VapC family toxin n=1 Tax=Mesorhizobium koreense TaxID=3074855 RepID=UPI00287BA7F1|nr:type II toxin-antitoxin system VapC family toxin [Mesorhizobium sp. WR6]